MARLPILMCVCLMFSCATAQVAFEVQADCEQAVVLQLAQDQAHFRMAAPPQGAGMLQEMSARKGDSLWISQEHHSAWVTWQSPFSGYLGFDLIPDQLRDDYDFLLFRDSAGLGCEAIRSKELLPERSLISRNDPQIRSQTGLHGDMNVSHVAAGPGPAYGQAVNVTRGERWIMLIDNVYDKGEACELLFHYFYDPRLSGFVLNAENDSPLVAEIVLLELPGDSLLEELSTDTSGEFSTPRLLEFQTRYRLTASAEGYLHKELAISYQALKNNGAKPIVVKLVPNKPGATLDLPQAHFVGDKAIFLPEAYVALEEMRRTLLSHPDLHVRIEGHVNGVGTVDCEHDPHSMELSLDRAIAVRNYLIEHGISADRLRAEGFGCIYMVYPNATNERQMSANRRVALVVE
ncbi:MAG: OmpA family protein [Bacteroidia bacterium]|nr:OmpA family protein [Bacteroidia bacterium]